MSEPAEDYTEGESSEDRLRNTPITEVPVDQIGVAERRRALNADAVTDLAEAIEREGLVNPITVVALGGQAFRVVAGLHRLEAVRSLGWESINARIVDVDNTEAALIEIDENLARAPLSDKERYEHAAERAELTMGNDFPRSDDGTFRDQGRRQSDRDLAKKVNKTDRTTRSWRLAGEALKQLDPGLRERLDDWPHMSPGTLRTFAEHGDQQKIAELLDAGNAPNDVASEIRERRPAPADGLSKEVKAKMAANKAAEKRFKAVDQHLGEGMDLLRALVPGLLSDGIDQAYHDRLVAIEDPEAIWEAFARHQDLGPAMQHFARDGIDLAPLVNRFAEVFNVLAKWDEGTREQVIALLNFWSQHQYEDDED